MLTERQAHVLLTVVDEYIKNASPVSSGTVFDIGNFEISCPTIRNEMAELTERGYLFQPHTSAGRVPTEQGYRFFVNDFMEKHLSKIYSSSNLSKMENFKRGRIKEQAQAIAVRVNDVVVFVDEDGEVQYLGLKKAFHKPEFEDRSSIIAFIEELERLEDSINETSENLCDELAVFIGSENPFFHDKRYSMLISPAGEGYISIVGPMRMNYPRNFSFLIGL